MRDVADQLHHGRHRRNIVTLVKLEALGKIVDAFELGEKVMLRGMPEPGDGVVPAGGQRPSREQPTPPVEG